MLNFRKDNDLFTIIHNSFCIFAKKYIVMKNLLFILFFVMCSINCTAQTFIEPVFDRTDTPNLHINKIEITDDTTFVYCTYIAETGSWANISPKTFIKDLNTNEKYYIIRCEGIPFAPAKQEFKIDTLTYYPIVFVFPAITNPSKIDFIEDPANEAFNIHGINLHKSFTYIYKYDKLQTLTDSVNITLNNNNDDKLIRTYIRKQHEAFDYWYGIRSYYSSCSMYNYMQFFHQKNNYDKAIEWGKKAIDILHDFSEDSTSLEPLARAYIYIGTAYCMKQQIETGLYYYELSLSIRRTYKNVGVLSYEELLGELSRSYYYIGNYPKALLYGKELVEFYKEKYEEDSSKYQCVYLNSLNNLCAYMISMSNSQEAVEIGMLAKDLLEKSQDICETNFRLKLATYHNLGLSLHATGKQNEAKRFLKKIIQDADRQKKEENDETILHTQMLLTDINFVEQHDTTKAINEYKTILKKIELDSIKSNLYEEVCHKIFSLYREKNNGLSLVYLNKCLQYTKDKYGEDNVAYAMLLSDYISITWMNSIYKNEELDTLYEYTKKTTNILKKNVCTSFFCMPNTLRAQYWKQPKFQDLFTWLLPTISSLTNTDKWNSLAFDASLFYKGILLSSEIEYRKAIEDCNDSILIRQYADYTKNVSFLQEQSCMKIPTINVDSLKWIIQQYEYDISKRITWLNKQYLGTIITWQDVKNKLKDNEVAIEFMSFRDLKDEKTIYSAYIINNKSIAPKLIVLFCEEDIKKLINAENIDYFGISNLIWGNIGLQKELLNIKNIYFSASGILYTLGIEYLPITKDMNIYDKYNIYRLTSTRELCSQEKKTSIKNVCLYGGLDYNSKHFNSEIDHTKITKHHELSRSILDTLIQRGDFEQLKGSKQEVEQINNIITSKEINCKTFMGVNGTETSLKKLSGNPINIIHISTHGMYIPSENSSIKQTHDFSFIVSNDDSIFDKETKDLSRSFIVMSGGNSLCHRKVIPLGQDDGILTASEISHLIFPELDLVVLSACQTGFGSVEPEGVFGLQRGFKKAGANTILMSIDKVDDEATRILMVEFYSNLISGKSKHQSLKDAQKYLRGYDNGKYDDPKYWASFIMLDGLN